MTDKRKTAEFGETIDLYSNLYRGYLYTRRLYFLALIGMSVSERDTDIYLLVMKNVQSRLNNLSKNLNKEILDDLRMSIEESFLLETEGGHIAMLLQRVTDLTFARMAIEDISSNLPPHLVNLREINENHIARWRDEIYELLSEIDYLDYIYSRLQES